jgi:hypothetical protein
MTNFFSEDGLSLWKFQWCQAKYFRISTGAWNLINKMYKMY